MKRSKTFGLATCTFLVILLLLPSAFALPFADVEGQYLSLEGLEAEIVRTVCGASAYSIDRELEQIALDHLAFRSAGSAGANQTADWIETKLRGFGLEAWNESFEFRTWDLAAPPELFIDEDGSSDTVNDRRVIESFQSEHWSFPSADGVVFGDAVILPLPEADGRADVGTNPIDQDAWDQINTTGKILFIGKEVRWSAEWEDAYVQKLSAQTPAAIVLVWWYDWMSAVGPMIQSSGGGLPLSGAGDYYWDLEIPVGSVNYSDSAWIRELFESAAFSASLSIESLISIGEHRNVIGRIQGSSDDERLVISAHYDTVLCPGFCDNGAGVAGVIELARVLSQAAANGSYAPKASIFFVLFAAEELGMVGSMNYVWTHAEEMNDVVAVLNLDSIGSDNLLATRTEPGESFDLDELVSDAAEDLDAPLVFWVSGNSDQQSFEDPEAVADTYVWRWGAGPGPISYHPVPSSSMIASIPLDYSSVWSTGEIGWIHTSLDRSESTAAFEWIEEEDLETQIEVACLATLRITGGLSEPSLPIEILMVVGAAAVGTVVLVFLRVRGRR